MGRYSLLLGLNFPVAEDYFCLETWQDQPVPEGKTSRFLNVGWHRRRRKFAALTNSGRLHVGYFDCELDAAFAADRASLKYGEGATNFHPDTYTDTALTLPSSVDGLSPQQSQVVGVVIDTVPVEEHVASQHLRRAQLALLVKRAELPLTIALQRYLEALGHDVGARRYSEVDASGKKAEVARCDVFDHTTSTVYEVKSKVDMASLCKGVGQLRWYGHLEDTTNEGQLGVSLVLALPARLVNELGRTVKAWLANLQVQAIGIVLV